MNADPAAVLYFRRAGDSYRVKVFDLTVWIERQPGGDNLVYARADHPVFDGQAWDFDALAGLVDIYRADCADAQQHALGAPAHVETYRTYTINVWQQRGGFYAEIETDGDNGAAQGLYEDIASAVVECQRMIDHPYD